MRPDEAARRDETSRAAALPEDHVPGPHETAEALLDEDIAEAEVVGKDEQGATDSMDPGFDLPDDADAAREILVGALMESRREAGEYLETVQRVAAEFDNYRKRIERDYTANVRRAAEGLVEQLLPALDSFDAALGYEPQTPAEEKILAGMRSTYGQLMDTLSKQGLEPVPAVGHGFDPRVHEAVAGPAGGDGDLVVVQELRRGYLFQDRLLRPSLVTVEARADREERG